MKSERYLLLLGALFVSACSVNGADEADEHEQQLGSIRPPQSPPVQPVSPHSPPDAPFSPAASLPTTPVVVRDGHVTRFAGEQGVVELTAVDPGVGHAVSQPEAANICRRLDFGGKTGWYLPDERTLLAMAGNVEPREWVWSNVDYVMQSGFTGVDPTSGATDLRMMGSRIRLADGAFQGTDHALSTLGSNAHFVCIHTEQPILDWRSCMNAPNALQRCMCLAFWFVPPRSSWECN